MILINQYLKICNLLLFHSNLVLLHFVGAPHNCSGILPRNEVKRVKLTNVIFTKLCLYMSKMEHGKNKSIYRQSFILKTPSLKYLVFPLNIIFVIIVPKMKNSQKSKVNLVQIAMHENISIM